MASRRRRGRSRSEERRCRGLQFESLEVRHLLSGAHDPQLVEAIRSAVSSSNNQGLSAWSDRLTGASLLGRSIPLLGTQLGSQYGPRAQLNSLLSQLGPPSASPETLDALGNALDAIPGVTVSARRDLPDNLELDVRFQTTATITVPIHSSFGGVQLAATGNVTATVTLDFQLTVGAFWNGSASLAYFSSTNDALNVAATLSGTAVNSSARLGFVDVNLSNTAATLGAEFQFDLTDPGTGGNADGRVTLSELNNTPVTTLVGSNLQATAGPAFSTTLSSEFLPTPQTLTISWPDITDVSQVTSNLDALGLYQGFEQTSATTFTNGLTNFASWAGLANGVTMFGRSFPLVGTQLKDAVDLPGLLQSKLVSSVGLYNSAQTLRDRLAAVSGVSNVTLTLDGNELRYTLHLAAHRQRTVTFDLGRPDLLPLSLNVPGLQLVADVAADLTFGVDLGGATPAFFVGVSSDDTPEVRVDLSLAANNFTASGGVGFISVNATGGTAQITGAASLDLTAGSGRITPQDFAAGAASFGSFATYAVGGSASTSMSLSSPLLGAPTRILSASWSDLTDLSNVVTNADEFTDLTGWENVQATTFSFGLQQLKNFLGQMAQNNLSGSNPLKAPLPLVDRSAADLIDFAQYFQDALTSRTDVTWAADGSEQRTFSTSSDLTALLQSLPGAANEVVTASATADDVRYRLQFDRSTSKIAPLDLGLDSQVQLNLTGNVTWQLAGHVDVTFGVNKEDGRFFIADTGLPVFTGTGSVSMNVTADTNLGFLGVNVTNATATMNASVSVGLNDPAGDSPASPGKITTNELVLGNVVALADVSVGGSASASLPLSTTLFPETATLTASWPDVLHPETFTVNTAAIQKFFNFNSITPESVLDGLKQLPLVLDRLVDAAAFGQNLPLVGANLKNLVHLGNDVESWLNNMVNVASVQRLRSELERVLGLPAGTVSVTVGSDDVQFLVHFKHNIVNASTAFSIDEGVQGAGFQANGNLTVNGTVDAGVRFGLSYAPALAAGDRFYVVAGADSNVALTVKGSATFNASGTLGLLTVNVNNGTADLAGRTGGVIDTTKSARIALSLVDPGAAPDGKITATEMLQDPAGVLGPATMDAAARAVLPLSASGLPVSPPPKITFNWSDLNSFGSLTVTPENLDALLNAATNFSPTTAVAGIQAILQLISGWANVDLLKTRLPLVDVKLSDVFNYAGELSRFFNQLTSGYSTAAQFDAKVQGALAVAGLNSNEVSLVPSADPAQHDPSQGRFRYTLGYHYDRVLADIPFQFGGGLFTLDAHFTPRVTFDVNLGFGLNKDAGFFLVDRGGAGPEVQLQFQVDGDFNRIGGEFGPIAYGVRNGTGVAQVGLAVDLTDPNQSGGRITASELKGSFTQVVQPQISGSADLDLPIGFHLGGPQAPGVTTRFTAHWRPDRPDAFTFGDSFSTSAADGFGDVNFELGEFVAGMIGPVLKNVRDYNPLPPEMVEFLTTKLPLINETPLDLLGTLTGTPKEINLLFEILNVVNRIPTGESSVNLEPFFAAGQESAPPNPSSGSPTGGSTGGSGPFLDFRNDLEADYGLKFPVLNDVTGAIVKVLLNEDVDLVLWDPGRLSLPYTLPDVRVPFFNFGIPGLADVTAYAIFGGSFELFANINIGLTTRGLTQDLDNDGTADRNLLNGFFVGDNRPNAPNRNPDEFEVGFTAEVHAGVQGAARVIGFDIVKVTGTGGIRGTLGLDFADVNPNSSEPGNVDGKMIVPRDKNGGDGRVHLDEIECLVNNWGPLCALNFGGEVDLEINLSGEVCLPILGCITVFSVGLDIPIYSFNISCDNKPESNLADRDGNVIRMLDDGSDADHRVNVSLVKGPDGRPDRLRFSKTVDKEFFYDDFPLLDDTDPDYIGDGGVTALIVEGSPGKDKIRIDPSVTQKIFHTTTGSDTVANPLQITHITVNAHDGDDLVDFGVLDPADGFFLGGTTINGGGGNDILIGTPYSDTINGGAGDDAVTADGGDDTIDGGEGNDDLGGGEGDDTIYGGPGADKIYGHEGRNVVYGGDGDDQIITGHGIDTIAGEGGADLIVAGGGDDRVQGGDGNDYILGGLGNDFLYGDAGNDELHGAEGDDYLTAGAGNDLVYGEAGYDVLVQTIGGTQTLTDTTLDGYGHDTFASVERVNLYGVGSDDTFDVSEFTGVAYLDGGGGSDTVRSTNDDDFLLADWNLRRALGGSFPLTSIERAALTGGAGDNTFDVTNWTRLATLDGGGPGNDRVLAVNDADFTLSDASLVRSSGGSFQLSDINQAQLTGGLGNNTLDASTFSGRAILSGGEGNDVLRGGSGPDELDGGLGTDDLNGNAGDDVLWGGGGAGDVLRGGDHDDILHGSDDGADSLFGDAGDDRLLGNAGNDQLQGGTGRDILLGGLGDDTLSGDEGADLLLGEGGNDVLYAFRSGAGTDSTVNYLYGDFGTNGNEPDSGGDRLFGSAGNDLLFGEGGDDQLQGGGPSAILDFGGGEGAVPEDFVPPPLTPDPPLTPGSGSWPAASSLPTGVDYRGRWTELAGSASGDGLSGDPGMSRDPSIAAGANSQIVAWSDNRNGNFEIHVAQHTPAGWQELAGSGHDGGISSTAGSSRQPSVTLDGSGQPLVAWVESGLFFSWVRAARYDASANAGSGGWVSLGDVSAGGTVGSPVVVNTTAGPVVAWLDTTGGVTNVYAKRFNGTTWESFGTGGASGSGVSNSAAGVTGFALATDGTQVAVAWSEDRGGGAELFLRQSSGGAWAELGGSASGGGISNTAGESTQPTLAYLGGQLFAAWEDDTSGSGEIYAARFNGSAWVAAGTGANSGGGVSSSGGQSSQPRLAAGGGRLHLLWTDDRVAGLTGNTLALYVKTWTGAEFAEELAGDARQRGFAGIVAPQTTALTIDPAGHPFAAWTDVGSGSPEIYVRGNTWQLGEVYYVNDDSLLSDTYATATGSAANDGRSPATPKATVAEILAAYDLNPGDVVLVDTGSYADGFTLTGEDAGALLLGSVIQGTIIEGPVNVQAASGSVLRNLTLADDLIVTGGTQITVTENVFQQASLRVSGGSAAQLVHNLFENAGTAIVLSEGAAATVVEHNRVLSGTNGLSIGTNGATGVTVRDNRIRVSGVGISLAAPAGGAISGNDVAGNSIALNVQAAFVGLIADNDFHHANVGIVHGSGATLSGNRVRDNATGISSALTGSSALGFAPGVQPNAIFRNATGVQLSGNMQGQHVYQNTTGVSGSGQLVAADLDHANVIEFNGVGVDVTGPVQFNRVARNSTGVSAANSQLIAHNLIYRNAQGVHVSGKSDARIISNTFYTPAGDNVRVVNGSQQVEVRDNILWTENGYDIYVANDSVTGFFSDYNVLHASGAGKVGFWTKDFTDILDWQEDIYQFDLHSIGTTVVDPTWSEPQFFSRAGDDYRVYELLARQRFSSPTVDAGDPLTDLALSADIVNLLNNPSFESGLTGWAVTPSGATQNANPAPFEGSTYFAAGPNPTTTLQQTIDLPAAGFAPTQLDGHGLSVVFGARTRSAAEDPRDKGTLTVTILDGGGNVLGVPYVVQSANTADRWELLGGRAYLPAGARQVRFQYDAVRQSGTTNDAYVDRAFAYLRPHTAAPDLGALGNTAAEADQPALARLVLRTPDLYKDWERSKPIDIRWDSYGNTADAPVVIDLYQDTPQGPAWLQRLSGGTADDGQFTWIAADSGIDFGTYGLRVQVSLADNPTVVSRSTETFTVPEDTNTFFVNDGSTGGDEFTSAHGDNRATGHLAAAPKPYPNNVLRIYSLGADQRLWVDTGDYPLLYPLLVSNILGVGDDEGFRMTGAASHTSTFRHANPYTTAAVVELNNADFVTLDNLSLSGGTRGLWARNVSTNLTANNIHSFGNTQEGIRVDTGSSILGFDGVAATGNSGAGLFVDGLVGTISGGSFSGNAGHGMDLRDIGNARIVSSEIAQNTGRDVRGVVINNQVAGTMAVFGDPDVSLGLGNRVHDNATYGIFATGRVEVTGNTVYGHVGANNYGIAATNGASVRRNVLHDNTSGLYSNARAPVAENRSYHNQDAGLVLDSTTPATGNVVYSNAVGVRTLLSYDGNLTNNAVYANTNQGVLVDGSGYYGGVRELVNNTIYQTTGDAIRVQGPARDVRVRNNILWVEGGPALSVASESQVGFASDYNVFFTPGAGYVAFWQGGVRPTLLSWQSTAFTDGNSVSRNPQFISPAGADGVLGYASAAQDGRDDDFHVQSLHGSYHGGSFAPVATDGGTGAPAPLTGTWVNDAVQSPAIDRGAPGDSYVNEPAPSGNYINVGAYGNTAQASRSPAEYVLVTKPDGGEVWPAQQTFPIRWRSHDLNLTFQLELLQQGNPTPLLTIAAAAPGTGEYVWTVPDTLPPATDYLIRVTRNDAGALSDMSDVPFSITAPINVYYVNDDAVAAGDWTTAPGDDSLNDGLSPASPLASISAVLARYDLDPGDVIRADAGTYNLSTNLIIDAADAGVTLEGYHDGAYPDRAAVLNRDNTSNGAYVVELRNADGVTISHLAITGGNQGIYADAASDTDGLTVRDSRIYGNLNYGIYLATGNDAPTLTGNTLSSQYYAIETWGTDATISGNAVGQHTYRGIYVRGARSVVEGNEVAIISVGNQGVGIDANFTGAAADRILVQNNVVHDNNAAGLSVSGQVLATGNEIYNHAASWGVGVYVSSGAEFRANRVHDNNTGVSNGSGLVVDNRIYHNIGVGLSLDATGRGVRNRIHDNGIGIRTGLSQHVPVEGNLVYRNTTYGMLIDGSGYYGDTPEIVNNVVYQSSGDAIHVQGPAQNVRVRNNILWARFGYVFSVNPESERNFQSDYNVLYTTGQGRLGLWEGRSFTNRTDWFYELGLDAHSVFADPQFIDPDGDDDFHVAATSPAVDRGDLASYWLQETVPSGDRIDAGAYGNRADGAVSPSPLVQILAPNGLEKFELGQTAAIAWRSAGLTLNRPVALINSGGPTVDNFLVDAYRTNGSTASSTAAVDLSGVTDPAPAGVYQTISYGTSGVGGKLSYSLPLADGAYTVRLHFIERSYTTGGRVFDINLNGSTVQANFDIYATAGGFGKATIAQYHVNLVGGTGLAIDLISRGIREATLAAVEILAANPAGQADPRVDLEVSADGGATWSPLAADLGMDRFGRGQYAWQISNGLPESSQYLVRVVSGAGLEPVEDVSDETFTVANAGIHYYVNDGSTAGDQFTTAPGDNANSGKSPAQPMASLAALIAAYDLDPGDIVHVDTGDYSLIRNVVLTAQDSGLRIEGPGSGLAVINRGNSNSGSYIFDLQNADNVTLDRLHLTGAETAVYLGSNSDSDGLTISNSRIYLNTHRGVYAETGNDFVTVTDSQFDGGASQVQNYGVWLLGTDTTLDGNHFTKAGYDAIVVRGARSVISHNELVNNGRGNSGNGINASNLSNTPADRILISGNRVSGSTANGIYATSNALVIGNEVFHQRTGQMVGISGGAEVRDNLVYDNGTGISAATGLITGNRVYNNTTGIAADSGARVLANRVYNNTTGIWLGTSFYELLGNNLIYGNTGQGVWVVHSGYYGNVQQIVGNTFYQPTGTALRIDNDASLTKVRNNIFSVGSGYGITVADDSQPGFESDYNLFQLTGPGKIARWQSVDYTDRAAWFFEIGQDQHSLVADPQFVNPAGPDGVLGFAGGLDGGADDDFRIAAGSPAVDRGDPNDPYFFEPAPMGERADLGAFGHSAGAAASPEQLVQILAPNGLEKFEQGQAVTVSYRSAGLTENRTVALFGSATADAGAWQAGSPYQTAGSRATFANPVDLSGVDDPAPAAVYNGYAYGNGGVGGTLAYSLPLPNGNYSVRLHFVEPTYTTAGSRRFDIRMNGTTVRTNYDVFAEAGGRYRAVTSTFTNVPITGGTLALELVNVTSSSAILSAIEIFAANPAGVAAPTVDLQFSADDGATWNTVATDLPLDRYGQGSYVWTAGPPTTGNTARFRVVANQGTLPQDDSDGGFLIAGSGPDYYVSPTGDDLDSGKDPAHPMKTLAALVDAYDLDAGDVVHVAAGQYAVLRNVVLTGQDSGATVRGLDAGTAQLSRGNPNPGSYHFELRNADQITLAVLRLSGGEIGIYAADNADSDDLTVVDSSIVANDYAGLYFGSTNDRAILSDNVWYGVPGGATTDDQDYGIVLNDTSADHVMSGNEIYDHYYTGLTLRGARAVASGNDVHGNRTGISARYNGSTQDRQTVSGNAVHDNTETGIDATYQVLLLGNDVYGQNGTNDTGIAASAGVEISANTVRGNDNGIYAGDQTYLHENRLYDNANFAINADYDARILSNYVYSNSVGLHTLTNFRGQVFDNLIYANTNRGLWLQNSNASTSPEIVNNTIYQPVGDAIRLDGSARYVALRNNLIWVLSGYDLWVDTNSQNGFTSDYNLLHQGTDVNAHVGYWGNVVRDGLADWQTASAQDAHSLTGDPLFVDIDGADNVLGYVASPGGGTHGGRDDNFYRAKLSLAIDRGDPWSAPRTDIEGFPRVDDPGVPNAGGNDYVPSVPGGSSFAATGTAQNWRSNNTYYTYTLPFAFPLYGGSFTTVYVSTEGFLQFGSNTSAGSGSNSLSELSAYRRLAPLWDNLRTNGTGDNIYVDTSVSGQVKFRWDATNEADGSDVNFSVTLLSTGLFRFDYGPGNTALTPTVGISLGNGRAYQTVAGYDGAAALANAASVVFGLAPSFVDIGAYEFRGNSVDATAPTVSATNPAVVDAGGTTGSRISAIHVTFSEEVNPIDANAPAVYELRGAGPNGTFDDADDVLYVVTPQYSPGQDTVALDIDVAGAVLPSGQYRLTVFGRSNTAIHDLAGLRLDGNGDSAEGGDYVRTFAVLPPGITVTPTSGLTTSEAGDFATFSVVLETEPAADVTIVLTSSVPTEADVAPPSLVFTPVNWNIPQVVTVTGIDDPVDDDDVTLTIVTEAAVSADPNYAGRNAADVSVTNADDDAAGITVSPTSGLVTTETGGAVSFTIVLHSRPTADVTIGISSSDTSEGDVAPASLLFTSANWNTPQTVTVTGLPDALSDGDAAYQILTAAALSADPKYNGLDADDVSVTNLDQDNAGITVTPTAGLATTEAGGTASFTIVLDSQPTADVTIGVASDDPSEGAVSPASLTFTAANWSQPQTVTVTGQDDFVDDGDVAFTIVTAAAVSSDPNYSGRDPADVSVTNTDNDTAGITVTPTAGLTTTEAGGTASFTIVLDSQPTADVTIGVASDDPSEGAVSPASLTFTAANWSQPQTVTVTGLDDFVDDGDVAFTIVTAAAVSSDPNYSGRDPADVSLTNTDNDTPGITVTPTAGLTTTEAGGTASFTIVLDSQPAADVTIGVSSDDPSEGTVLPTSLIFTSANWNQPQTVTVTGQDDFVDDGNVAFTIVTAAAVSDDPNYSGRDPDDVSLTNTDNDTAGITITPTAGFTTTEAGGTASFTIVLDSQPAADVTIGVSSDDPSEGAVSPTNLIFTSANWNQPQTVTVTGQDDFVDDGDVAFTIVTAAAVSSDPNYSGRDPADVSVVNTDNDTAGITVTPTAGLTTTETGGTATFTIVLDSQPTADVTIGVSSDDPSEGAVSPTNLIFTSANWNQPQTVTVTGQDDFADDGDVAFTIVTAAAVSSDPNYSGRDPADVSAINIELRQYRFDFNANSRFTATGYTGVLRSHVYTTARGYGWASKASAYDRRLPDNLRRDGHSGRSNMFRVAVDMSQASYVVTVYVGHRSRVADNVQILLEGVPQTVVSTARGQFLTQSFAIQTSAISPDGILDIGFVDLDTRRTRRYFAVNGVEIATPQRLAGLVPHAAGDSQAAALSQRDLAAILQAATDRWLATGLTPELAARLQSVTATVEDLRGPGYLALNNGLVLRIDDDAAGRGWFIDPSPAAADEFFDAAGSGRHLPARPDSKALDRVDLLTVVMHELGHVLGRPDLGSPDSADDLMHGELSAGTRRTLDANVWAEAADAVWPSWNN